LSCSGNRRRHMWDYWLDGPEGRVTMRTCRYCSRREALLYGEWTWDGDMGGKK
jgi:hypothetical protein